MLGLPVDVAATALGLRLMAGPESVLRLHPARIARELFAGEDHATAIDRLVLHVLMLEDAGLVSTWAEDGTEWLALSSLLGSPPDAAQRPPGPSSCPSQGSVSPPHFQRLGRERKKEEEHVRTSERERARASARARAQELADEEERWQRDRWDGEYARERRAPARPERPAILDAPPRGCPDHPLGTVSSSCGPCGTAADRRRTFLAKARYVEQLAFFEEYWADQEVPDDDKPF